MSHFQSSSSYLVKRKSHNELFLISFRFEYLKKKNATAKIKIKEQRMMIKSTGTPPIPLMKNMKGLKHSGFTLAGLSPLLHS